MFSNKKKPATSGIYVRVLWINLCLMVYLLNENVIEHVWCLQCLANKCKAFHTGLKEEAPL